MALKFQKYAMGHGAFHLSTKKFKSPEKIFKKKNNNN